MGRDKVSLFAAIREDSRQGMGIRAIARKHGVHRRTVREALSCPVPAPRKVPEREAPTREAVAPLVDAMLRADFEAPRKQWHTATRVHARLADEYGLHPSYSYVAKYVSARRRELAAGRAARADSMEGFVPQAKEPAMEAEVDFGEVAVVLDGRRQTCYLFCYRLSYSGMAVHRVFASCAQESLLEGHVEAFGVTGGVPAGHVRYDNLTPAVVRVLKGRDRKENSRWTLFRSWYGFDAFYCEPGQEGAHEKGGVEGEIGRSRRTFMVPVPEVATLRQLNAGLAEAEMAEAQARHIERRPNTVAADFAVEAPLLRPLPGEAYDTATTLWPRADKFSRVAVGKCRYSVPARFIGTAVRVRLTGSELLVMDGSKVVAVHPRQAAAGAEHLVLDHYLEILLRKPGALAGSAPLAQARRDGTFTSAHDALWAGLRRKLGDREATRPLIEVLLLHRRLPHGAVVAGIGAALAAGSCSPEVVAVEARKHAEAAGRAAGGAVPVPRRGAAAVITLPASRGGSLPADPRPAPDVAVYDQLLGAAGQNGGA